jgi:protease-4
MNLFNSIMRGTWMIDPRFLEAAIPLVHQAFKGKPDALSVLGSHMQSEEVDLEKRVASSQSFSTSVSNQATIYHLKVEGVILKNDYCGDAGLVTLEKYILRAANDPKVAAIWLEIDTGGGEASYLAAFAQTIRDVKAMKPVIGFTMGGMCCSAGYYIMSQCTAAFMGTRSDEVGSIGTMWAFYGQGPKSKAWNVLHYVNATKSVDKNKNWLDALEGNYEGLRKSMDPMNDEFHRQIKLSRPNVSEEALTGKVYYYEDAIALGLVDGLKNRAEILEYTIDLLENNDQTGKNQNAINMKNEKLSAILGRDVNAGEVLSQEDMQKVSDHITKVEGELETAQSQNEKLTTNLASATQERDEARQQMTELDKNQSAIEARLKALEEGSGAQKHEAGKNSGDAEEVEAWAKPDSKLNQYAAQQLGIK